MKPTLLTFALCAAAFTFSACGDDKGPGGGNDATARQYREHCQANCALQVECDIDVDLKECSTNCVSQAQFLSIFIDFIGRQQGGKDCARALADAYQCAFSVQYSCGEFGEGYDDLPPECELAQERMDRFCDDFD